MSVACVPLGLGLMCKPPRPGSSKTRLAASIGDAAAAALSRAFLQDCASVCTAAAGQDGLVTVAFYRPADAGAEIEALLSPGWSTEYCHRGDFGASMLAALASLLAKAPGGAMIMAADIPLIGPAEIRAAADALRSGDPRSVVVIPSDDGGYGLIGVRSAEVAAPLFAPMAWSTPSVLGETLSRALQARLQVTVLPSQRDIDDQDDLAWLQAALQERADGASATRAALALLGDRADAQGRATDPLARLARLQRR